MSRTVLITGGAGFIGSYVARLLAERGDDVVALDIREPGPEAAWQLAPVAGRVRHVRGSVDVWSDVVAAVKAWEPDGIVHTAAIVDPVLLSRRPALALDVNLRGAFNVLEAARLWGVGRVVNFSTIGVLPGIRYEPVDADHPVLLATEGPGASFYAAAKVGAEALCWAYHQSYGLDFVTIRPSAVYGFGMQWPIYLKPMVEGAVRGVAVRFERGADFPRDYTHAADVAQLAVRSLDISPEHVRDRVFYGATGEPLVTAGRAAELVRAAVPGADVEIGPGLSEEDEVEIRYRGVLDITAARERLGYEPRYRNLGEGIAEYAATYRRYLAEAGGGTPSG